MKLIIIPPFRPKALREGGDYFVREVLDEMEKKGALEGVEIDIDAGFYVENPTEQTNEEMRVRLTIGIINRVRMYCDGTKYDAIVTSGGYDQGFLSARMLSQIPVAGALHSVVHAASLIGDRFTIIHLSDPYSLVIRHLVESYGFGNKLASVRAVGCSATFVNEMLPKYKKGERGKAPEGKKLLDDFVAHCIKGIEDERADSLIFVSPHHSCLADEVRQRLDELGYCEIPLVLGLPAAVEMAKSMVNMRLKQAARAYPSDDLKAKPAFR